MFNRWLVVVCSSKLVEELRKAPDDELSFMEATNEVSLIFSVGLNRCHTDVLPIFLFIVARD